ncbi:hypothetical protein BDY17DRAFT_325232 [Neohortaea acidophila]|uniref:SAP domain-containing protein n=1 Tax=Neohortaea acidophila TaxID=245834 RepID=A0A6A6PP77_9PEZI|nr:uncharacterized protein BDY17DRAFT_325232 [Neohortaea acidophila]KAF2481715.1 hypothetical protein BDY17DRAFT_325232 [Neohortaea acidophila]
MATDYNKLKVVELKEILKVRGIPSTGLSRKAQIVEALEENDREQAGAAAEDGENAEQPAEVKGEDAVAQEEDLPEAQQAQPVESAPEIVLPEQPTEAMEDVVEEQSVQTELPLDTSTSTLAPLSDLPVLQSSEPFSKEPSTRTTPQPSSPATESVSSEIRKRKRRSRTPAPNEESVQKKLKAAEEEAALIVKLPEDQEEDKNAEEKMVEDAPVAVDRSAEIDSGDKILPYSSSDDVMKVDEEKQAQSPGAEHRTDLKAPTQPAHAEETGEGETATEPAIHPATRALYIRGLVRPLPAAQLRTHLVQLATAPNTSSSDSVVETLHIDQIRTHAFALFTSVSAAARTRSALHSHIWPDEPTRKPLWVDFVPEEKVEGWIEEELREEREGGRRGVKRWEVVYEEGTEGIEARLTEGSSATPAATAPARPGSTASAAGAGAGMPNAPLGPRGAKPPPSHEAAAPSLTKSTPTPAPSTASFDILDHRFSHTTSKPKLYFKPQLPVVVEERLDALASLTSRDWDDRKDGSFTFGGDVRRYTFEDGGKLVDGGPDIGNFGRPRGMELPGGGRRGGGGGGGGRGRR